MSSKVSIVVTAYLPESKPYLDNCIASIKNLDYPKELLDVILVCPMWYKPEYEGVRVIHPTLGAAYDNPVAVNVGMNAASKDSKYLLLLNDDTIMTRDSLKNMVQVAGDFDVVLGAISNDSGGFYSLYTGIIKDGVQTDLMDRQYRLDQIKDLIPEMMNAKSYYQRGLIFPQTLYMFANLIPRKVWERVTGGTTPDAIGFDENLKTSWDDSDFCLRARQRGIQLAICLDALIFHCGGVSADTTQGDLKSERRAESEALFRKKWNL